MDIKCKYQGKKAQRYFWLGVEETINELKFKGIHTKAGEWITVRGGVGEDSIEVDGTWVFIPDVSLKELVSTNGETGVNIE
jgi:hypothetical protein